MATKKKIIDAAEVRKRLRNANAKAKPKTTLDLDDAPWGQWLVQVQEMVMWRRGDRVRFGIVSGPAPDGRMHAFGFETQLAALSTVARNPMASIDATLADHSHANLGMFATSDAAKRACDAFIRSRKSVAACNCEAVQ